MPGPIFISYSHDSDMHRERALGLSERLRQDGFETRIDRYVNGSPAEGWPRWMLNRLDEASFVLVLCTETYYRRFRGRKRWQERGRNRLQKRFLTRMALNELYAFSGIRFGKECRGLVRYLDLGRRLTARGSLRLGRLPT